MLIDDLYHTTGVHAYQKAMKSPGIPTSYNEEDDDWTEFEESCSCDCHTVEQQWGRPKRETIFQTCFPFIQSSLPIPVESRVNDTRVR